jgi:hypothetical protein
MTINTDHTTEHKLTATQVEKDCPTKLQELGKCIAAHLEKARKCEDKADQHYRSIAQYLAEAKKACDDGGFDAFHKKFCPNLGRSRVYELVAIGANKKSLEATRADTRKRVAKLRAKKSDRFVAGNGHAGAGVAGDRSVRYVTDRSEPEPEPQDAPTTVGKVEAITAADQTPELAESRSAINPRDELLYNFSSAVVEVIRITKTRKAKHFAKTTVPADDLARLGKLLTDLANLKESVVKPTPTVISYGNVAVSPEQSAEDMKAKHAALDAAA